MRAAEGPEEVSSGTLVLATVDPQTGGTTDVPLRFVSFEGGFYVLAPSPLPRWYQMASARRPAIWTVGERTFSGEASVVRDGPLLTNTVMPLFSSAFGQGRLERWFGAEPRCLGLIPNAVGEQGPYSQLEALFDALAPDYDRIVGMNPFDSYLRTVSNAILLETFRPGERVLEIGCGTGLETIPLAANDIEVVALDLSRAMIGVLERKSTEAGFDDRIKLRKLRASELGAVLDEFGPAYFDGAFSNFGAMNTEPAWNAVPRLLAHLVKPGAQVVFGIWNRACLFEFAYYSLRLNFRRAFSRLASPVPVGRSRFGAAAYAFGVREFLAPFVPYFNMEQVLGLSVVLPPYDLGRKLGNPEAVLHRLAQVDGLLGKHFPFNRLGDHFLLTLRRREDSAKGDLT